MTIRKNDPALGVKGRHAPLDKKGFPVGGNIETDDDTGFNRQLPPGQDISNQMLSADTIRVTKLKAKSAASILASGTTNLD